MEEPKDRPTTEIEPFEPMTDAPASAEAPRPVEETSAEHEIGLPSEAETPADEAEAEAPQAEVELEVEPEAGVEPEVEAELEVDAEAERDDEAEPEADPEPEAEAGLEGELETAPEPEIEAEVEAEVGPAAAEAAGPAAPGEEPDDGRRWYVVHCYSGYESKVRHNLEQRIESMGMKAKIFDVVIPTEEEIEVKDGKRRTVERHVFPGYILVQMLMDEDSWYVVRNTPGVTGFVGMGNEPTPLRPEEVQQIIRRMEAEAPRVKVTYKAGQRVRIIDGPFNDFIGTVDEIDMERAKVRVMVSFFGRETPVELDFLQVEKA